MATNHTHHSGTYSGKKLHILTTSATNIRMYNLNGGKSLLDSSYYGVNGGFFSSRALNIAMSDGKVIGATTNNWCGGGVITWNGNYFKRYQTTQILAALDDDVLTKNGTWAQGGHDMRLGNSQWLTKLYGDIGGNPSKELKNIVEGSSLRTGIVVDTLSKNTYLIISDTACSFGGFRDAVQEYLGIKEAGENNRYYGLFLDGGGSTQMKYKQGSTTTEVDKSGQNRPLYQIIALRDPS